MGGAVAKAMAVDYPVSEDPCIEWVKPSEWSPPPPGGHQGDTGEGEEPSPILPFVDWPALYADDHEEVGWLVEGVIPDGPRGHDDLEHEERGR